MSQKDYNIAIVRQLSRSPTHIRGLARALDTNQTTIARKINGLYMKNIVDFRMEGKNKVYFLKKTLETRQYTYILEIHTLVSLIEVYPQLRRIIEEIRKTTTHLVILFGSYAKLTAKPDSDIDIYVETQDQRIKEAIEQIDSRIQAKIGRYDRKNPLIQEIEKSHVIIRGVEEYYEKNGLFTHAT